MAYWKIQKTRYFFGNNGILRGACGRTWVNAWTPFSAAQTGRAYLYPIAFTWSWSAHYDITTCKMLSFLSLMLKSVVILVISIAVSGFITVKKEEREEKEWPIGQRKKILWCLCQAGILNWEQVNFANQDTVLEIAKRCKLIPQNEYSLIGETKKKISEIFYMQSLPQEGKNSILEKRKELDQQKWQMRSMPLWMRFTAIRSNSSPANTFGQWRA